MKRASIEEFVMSHKMKSIINEICCRNCETLNLVMRWSVKSFTYSRGKWKLNIAKRKEEIRRLIHWCVFLFVLGRKRRRRRVFEFFPPIFLFLSRFRGFVFSFSHQLYSPAENTREIELYERRMAEIIYIERRCTLGGDALIEWFVRN